MSCKRVLVSGQVQGVFFRDTCRSTALAHGVAGWVRNLPDGRVEACFEGDPSAVDQLVAWSYEGPPAALIDQVEVHEEQPGGQTDFRVQPTPPSWPD